MIKPDKPIISAFTSLAFINIFSEDTITPRSTILYPLQARTTPTIFFPISWTSPFTVANKIVPFEIDLRLFFFLFSSIYGTKCATAFFMTLADFTTCGRNILPAPNKSPTLFIPSIKGPSITSIGLCISILACSVSSIIN